MAMIKPSAPFGISDFSSSPTPIIMPWGGSRPDIYIGSSWDDRLCGGYGTDILTGGAGADGFVFNTDPRIAERWNGSNIDRITDFAPGIDKIWLKHVFFNKIGKVGALRKDAFYIGKNAHDSSDRIVYNKKTGALFYDPDGNYKIEWEGSQPLIKFAQLSPGLSLTYKDFVIF